MNKQVLADLEEAYKIVESLGTDAFEPSHPEVTRTVVEIAKMLQRERHRYGVLGTDFKQFLENINREE